MTYYQGERRFEENLAQIKSKKLSMRAKMLLIRILEKILNLFRREGLQASIDKLSEELAQIKIERDRLLRREEALERENKGLTDQLLAFKHEVDLSEMATLKKDMEQIEMIREYWSRLIKLMALLETWKNWDNAGKRLEEIKASLSQCEDNFQKIKVLRKTLPELKETPLWDTFSIYLNEDNLKKITEIETSLDSVEVEEQRELAFKQLLEYLHRVWPEIKTKWEEMDLELRLGEKNG